MRAGAACPPARSHAQPCEVASRTTNEHLNQLRIVVLYMFQTRFHNSVRVNIDHHPLTGTFSALGDNESKLAKRTGLAEGNSLLQIVHLDESDSGGAIYTAYDCCVVACR